VYWMCIGLSWLPCLGSHPQYNKPPRLTFAQDRPGQRALEQHLNQARESVASGLLPDGVHSVDFVLEQLLNEVDMCHEHPSAAVSLELQHVQGLDFGVVSRNKAEVCVPFVANYLHTLLWHTLQHSSARVHEGLSAQQQLVNLPDNDDYILFEKQRISDHHDHGYQFPPWLIPVLGEHASVCTLLFPTSPWTSPSNMVLLILLSQPSTVKIKNVISFTHRRTWMRLETCFTCSPQSTPLSPQVCWDNAHVGAIGRVTSTPEQSQAGWTQPKLAQGVPHLSASKAPDGNNHCSGRGGGLPVSAGGRAAGAVTKICTNISTNTITQFHVLSGSTCSVRTIAVAV
jgi:hypothetical protein